MSELNLISIKSKIRQVTRLSRPDEAFVTGLWEQLSHSHSHPGLSREIPPGTARPVWIAIAVLLVLLTALFISVSAPAMSMLSSGNSSALRIPAYKPCKRLAW